MISVSRWSQNGHAGSVGSESGASSRRSSRLNDDALVSAPSVPFRNGGSIATAGLVLPDEERAITVAARPLDRSIVWLPRRAAPRLVPVDGSLDRITVDANKPGERAYTVSECRKARLTTRKDTRFNKSA